jgi:hypothetical protein
MTLRAAIFALVVLVPAVAVANTVECGANSFSYAEVDARPQGKSVRGPVVSYPDSLCADLIERRQNQIESLQIVVDPRSGSQVEPSRPSAQPRD